MFPELGVGVGVHALGAHGQAASEAPHLVAPTAADPAQGQPGEVWVLVPEQVADKVRGDHRLVLIHVTRR